MQLRDIRQPSDTVFRFSAVLLALSIAACEPAQLATTLTPATPPQPRTPADPVLAYVATAQIGQSAVVDDPAQGGNLIVVIDTQYNSAAGQVCRSYATTSSSLQSQHLACANGTEWQMVPPLILSSN
jgi:hypothetical protein